MTSVPPVEAIEQQAWLEPAETELQKAVGAVYESAGPIGRKLKNFMHGVWLGHPLHPVLTDIPLGAWSATFVLDLLDSAGQKGCAESADAALAIGLAGAAGSAVTGLTDWQSTDGAARRVGVVHGMLNLASTGLYAASLIQRRRRNREAGKILACLGFAVSAAAAYLGGDLVYAKQIGVNHTAGEALPKDWTPVKPASELHDGQPVQVDANGMKVLLLKRGEQIFGIADVCSHLGGPLSEGKIEGDTVECPWHGSRFCLRDGSVIDGPATHPQPNFETRVRDGHVEVRSRSED